MYRIERDYSHSEPLQAARDEPGQMLDALAYLRTLSPLPLVFVNHPSRTATALGHWGEVTPAELSAWNDAAPEVLVGMEGAPGHQAADPHRGLYRNAAAPTLGGFDQMTAQIGGVWDTMLAQGRHFWITATSDSHINQRDGGNDFDPGQYSKTYVWARRDAGDILDGLRHGRLFAVTGDLYRRAGPERVGTRPGHARSDDGPDPRACAGQADAHPPRHAHAGQENANGQRPALHHVEVIIGQAGEGSPLMQSRRFEVAELRREGDWLRLVWDLPAPSADGFIRVRGTSTTEATPLPDTPGEDPWQDLWFYSNPVFIEVATAAKRR